MSDSVSSVGHVNHIHGYISLCAKAVTRYSSSRPALYRQHQKLKTLAGGPWTVECKRAKTPGAMRTEVPGGPNGPLLRGAECSVEDAEPHSKIKQLYLLNANAEPPAEGTSAAAAQANLLFRLEQTREAVDCLHRLLPLVMEHAPKGIPTKPLSRLWATLPRFPYVPVKNHSMNAKFTCQGTPAQQLFLVADEEPPSADQFMEELTVEKNRLIAAKACLLRLSARLSARNNASGSGRDDGKQVARTKRQGTSPAFTVPPGLKWSEVSLEMERGSGYNARLVLRRDVHEINHAMLDMADYRTGAPNGQWELLKQMAQYNGELQWTSRNASKSLEKHKERLSSTLRRVLQINSAPIIKEGSGWKSRFRLSEYR